MNSADAITHKRVVGIALPILISNATVPLLGAVDTYAVGQLGAAAPIGAVGIGAVILSALYWLFGFLRMGTTGMVAQAVGAGNQDEVSAPLSRALLIALAAGVVLVALQIPLARAALTISPASDEVETLARSYIETRIWGAPAAISVYAMTGWLIAQERTRSVLVTQVAMNGGNVVLSLWFVLGLGWGVEGVAQATVIAEWGGAALGLWMCRSAFTRPAWRDRQRVLDPARLRRMIAVNTDIMIRSVLLQICFLTLTFRSASLGDVTLAANQILLQFLSVSAHVLDGFAFAAEALVGSAVGARNRTALRRAGWLTSLWGLGMVLLLTAFYALAGGWIIGEMTTAEPVQAAARDYLIWCIVAPLMGLPAFMLDGIFIGATRTRDMRNMMILSAGGYFALLLVTVPAFGNHGLWGALMAFFVLRALTLWWRYPALEADAARAA